MKKILSLLTISLIINITPIECGRSPHYVSETMRQWPVRLYHEAWEGVFQPPAERHSIEEFIGGLIRCARDGGDDAVINFLKEAANWGFALDSVSYIELTNGEASLNIIHLIALNDFGEHHYQTAFAAAKKIAKSISNIDSIISINDVKEISYWNSAGSLGSDKYFPLVTRLNIRLNIPLALIKDVKVDIAMQHVQIL